jgi:hypothetical protein
MAVIHTSAMRHRRALLLLRGYADGSSDDGEGDLESSAMIFDWDGDDDLGIEPSDLTGG